MAQPLLEPAALLSENCPECKGTGRAADPFDKTRVVECVRCEGSGREVREVPLSEVWEIAQRAHARAVAPPPSDLVRP